MHPISPETPGGLPQVCPLDGNPNPRRFSRLFVACLLSAGFLAPALFARQAPSAPSTEAEPFGERIEIRAINVETVVTDRRGRRIPGLTAADFELSVDGKPVPLEFFLEVQEGRAVAQAESAETPQPSLPPAARPGEPVPQSILVFIDELFSPVVKRKAALKLLLGELDRLGPEDQMAIVAMGNRGLTVLSPWSRSKDQLAAALRTGAQRTGYTSPSAPSSIELAEESFVDPDDNPPIFGKQGEFIEMRERLLKRMIEGATQAQRAFADTPGRKVMLMLSGNWERCDESVDNPRDCYNVLPLIDASNLLGYTVYPVRLEDVIETMPGAERRERQRPGEELRTAGLFSFLQEQLPMAFAADETGGRLLSMYGGYLTHAVKDLSSYYWLGFSADGALDDSRRRSIEVRVKGKNYKVRTRSSYLPLSSAAEAALRTESALLAGQPGSSSRPLQIVRHPLESAGRETVHLPVDLAIPLQELTLLPEGESWMARLELHTLAIDGRGDRSPMATIPIRLRFPSEPKAEGNVVYSTKLAIRPRPQKIEIQLTDALSGKALSAQVEVVAAELPL